MKQNLGHKSHGAGKHPAAHPSDHSGAHARGTHHHLANAHHTADAEGAGPGEHELQMGGAPALPGAMPGEPPEGAEDEIG